MSHQRTLLPYRLRVQAVEKLILEALEHDPEQLARASEFCDRIVTRAPGWTHDLFKLHRQLIAHAFLRVEDNLVERYALSLVNELRESAAVLALFEREWQFPHGFALVPLRAGVGPSLGGAA